MPLRVVIVGGGCSGVLAALALLKTDHRPLEISIFDPSPNLGYGIAYSTKDEQHLLNVPANRMGVWYQAPGDFFEWLTSRKYTISATDFAPRMWYARYLTERLHEEREKRLIDVSLSHVQSAICDLRPGVESRWTVVDSFAKEWSADSVILALGLPNVQWPRGTMGLESATLSVPRSIVVDSWSSQALTELAPDARVLLLGSGLTAVDSVLSLKAQNSRTSIVMLSRRGYLPKVHFDKPAGVSAQIIPPQSGRLRDWVRVFRDGCDLYRWDTVIDAIRADIPSIWSSFSVSEQKMFRRHIQPHFDVHRHRMAPSIAHKLRTWLNDKSVAVLAGRLRAVEARDGKVKAVLHLKRSSSPVTEIFDRVINCTGFGALSRGSFNGLLGKLVERNLIALDESGLGVRFSGTSPYCISEGLFICGALLRSMRWESIAVPELREQAYQIAEQVKEGS